MCLTDQNNPASNQTLDTSPSYKTMQNCGFHLALLIKFRGCEGGLRSEKGIGPGKKHTGGLKNKSKTEATQHSRVTMTMTADYLNLIIQRLFWSSDCFFVTSLSHYSAFSCPGAVGGFFFYYGDYYFQGTLAILTFLDFPSVKLILSFLIHVFPVSF